MNFCKSLCISLFFVWLCFVSIENAFSQERRRIVQTEAATELESPLSNPPQYIIARNIPIQTPALTNRILVKQPQLTLVRKTASSQPTNLPANKSANKNFYSAAFSSRLLQAIQARIGTPYRYGSTGPNSYDCSGLVWSVFQDAGFYFERTSARTLWQNSEAVEGDERYKFGTLVFFNGLGHIGIVADEKGFFHASSSKGVTYSTFDGYWANKIVGYRRLSVGNN